MQTNKLISLIVIFQFLSLIFYFFSPFITNEINYFDILISREMNGDIGYYPLVVEYSNLNFNPTFLENIKNDKFVSFPFLPIIIQSFLYKIFGVFSFVILIFIFQLLLILSLFILFKKILNHEVKSFYFIILLSIFLIIINIINLNFNINFLENIFNLFNSFFGFRYPRPLLTSPIIFFGIYLLIDFEKKISLNPSNYYITILIVLGLLLHLFFYYFIIFSFLIVLIFFVKIKKIDFKEINFFKLSFYTFLFFLIFIIPYILQQMNIEPDNSSRIGIINLNFDQRIDLINYFFSNFKRISFLSLLLFSTIFYFFSNKIFDKINIDGLNILFYLILSTFISIIVFILFSPKIISLYHFVDILIFSLIFYITTNIIIVVLNYFFKRNFNKYLMSRKSHVIIVGLLLLLNFYSISNSSHNNLEIIKGFKETKNFLKSYGLTKTQKKLFTFDLKIMNLWLLLDNKNLVISEGFSNVNKDLQIELNLINSLKYFGWSNNDFSNFISIGKTEIRNHDLMYLFIYKYQANSLYTFSEPQNYLTKFRNEIKNISPFRAQNQVVPEDEKNRLLNIFKNHVEDKDLLPDIIILNKLKDFKVMPFLKNDNFKKIFSSSVYDVFEKN